MAKCKFCGQGVRSGPVFHPACWKHRADFRLEDDRCEEWEEQNEICDVKHSPEVV